MYNANILLHLFGTQYTRFRCRLLMPSKQPGLQLNCNNPVSLIERLDCSANAGLYNTVSTVHN